VKDYDKHFLFPMLLKILPCITTYGRFEYVVDHINDEYYSLYIFEMLVGIPEATKELMNRELQMFRRYQVDANCTKLNGGKNINPCFQLLFSLLKILTFWDPK
jgi:hypothetical protein